MKLRHHSENLKHLDGLNLPKESKNFKIHLELQIQMEMVF
jgi:hypothetical protein